MPSIPLSQLFLPPLPRCLAEEAIGQEASAIENSEELLWQPHHKSRGAASFCTIKSDKHDCAFHSIRSIVSFKASQQRLHI